jgi:GNAT superfamily N-acetyltransferase
MQTILRKIKKEELDTFLRMVGKDHKEDAVVIQQLSHEVRNPSIVIHGIYFVDELIGVALTTADNKHLNSLFIKRDYRGNGVAATVAASLNVGSVTVTKDNVQALEFFEHIGFVVANDLPFAWQMTRAA